MRLLHTTDFILKDFIGDNIPRYAIISHRWSDEEPSYQDILSERKKFIRGRCSGYGGTKIAQACRIAKERRSEWVWIDTVCIDKKSSAELSEAINSMYAWYRDSAECYVFLPDVRSTANETIAPGSRDSRARSYGDGLDVGSRVAFSRSEFKVSQWFTRAWTLQELLAPQTIIFFSQGFWPIGRKRKLTDLISETSGISSDYLYGSNKAITKALIATRLKWDSGRTATRIEDRAYSLLGICGINMLLLYGEGEKAFFRLQKEIIRQTDDESIFTSSQPDNEIQAPLLAPNLSHFSTGPECETDFVVPRQHYEVTNMGVRLICNFPKKMVHTEYGIKVLLPLNLVQRGGRSPISWRNPCLLLHVRAPMLAGLSSPIHKYLWGCRLGMDLVTLEEHESLRRPSLSELERKARGLNEIRDISWDVFSGAITDEHEGIPVYFRI